MLKKLLKKIPGVKQLPGDLGYEEAREVLERNDFRHAYIPHAKSEARYLPFA